MELKFSKMKISKDKNAKSNFLSKDKFLQMETKYIEIKIWIKNKIFKKNKKNLKNQKIKEIFQENSDKNLKIKEEIINWLEAQILTSLIAKQLSQKSSFDNIQI